MRSLLSAANVVAVASSASAASKPKGVALFLLSVAVVLAGGATLVRAGSALDGLDPNANGTIRVVSGEQPSAQQPAILTTTSASNRAVVFPDANVPGTQILAALPAGAQPHPASYYGSDNALIAEGFSRVFVVQVSTGALISTIDTSPFYNGSGTIAVAPDQSAALGMGGVSTLSVIHAPFAMGATITQVALPGEIGVFQTEAIVFNNAGRAFVYHKMGISVLDPPYDAIAFTIPVEFNSFSGAIAISPDGNTLLTTLLTGAVVQIFQGPFSAATTSTNLTIPGANGLDGIMVVPDGSSAIVASAFAHHAAAIIAPFSSSSVVETLPLPAGTVGFEDVGISADSRLAIITGNGGSNTEAPILIKAPFTTAGAVTSYVSIMGVANPGRGNGAVRFRPATVAGPLQLTVAVSRKTHGGAGDFDIDLPLSAGPGVECRSTGGAFTLVFTFSNNVVSGNASVTSGTGSVSGSPTFSGNTMTVNLTGVANAQIVTVTLSNVTDSFSQVLPNTAVNAGFLIGDTNGDKFVNSGDTLQTRSRSGQTTTTTNFRSDVNLDGFVNSGDSIAVRARSGTALP